MCANGKAEIKLDDNIKWKNTIITGLVTRYGGADQEYLAAYTSEVVLDTAPL